MSPEEISNVIREILGNKTAEVGKISYFGKADINRVIEISNPNNLVILDNSLVKPRSVVNLSNVKWKYYNYDDECIVQLQPIIGMRSDDMDFNIVTKCNEETITSRKFIGRIHAYIRAKDRILYAFCIIDDSPVKDWHPMSVEDDGSVIIIKEGGLTKGAR